MKLPMEPDFFTVFRGLLGLSAKEAVGKFRGSDFADGAPKTLHLGAEWLGKSLLPTLCQHPSWRDCGWLQERSSTYLARYLYPSTRPWDTTWHSSRTPLHPLYIRLYSCCIRTKSAVNFSSTCQLSRSLHTELHIRREQTSMLTTSRKPNFGARVTTPPSDSRLANLLAIVISTRLHAFSFGFCDEEILST